MPPEGALLLALAVGLLLAAHVARAVRWAFLFPQKKAHVPRFPLLIGLGIGYAVNALIPLRVGEILRGLVSSRLTRMRFAEVMATIVAERVADLLVLALLIAATSTQASDPAFAIATAGLFAAAAAVAVVAALLVRASARLRRLLWQAAGVFNDRVRIGIADFAWSVAEMLVGGTLLRWRFLAATIGMWGLYAAAYAVFGWATGERLIDVVAAMLQRPLQSLTTAMPPAGAVGETSAFYAFVLVPVLLILMLEPLARSRIVARASTPLLRIGKAAHEARAERFSAANGYESFLGSLFSGSDRHVSTFGMDAVDDCVVHKFFLGGSDALTALVETRDRLLIRKFAAGAAAAHKLRVQADWLRRHAAPGLPLVEVIGERGSANDYRYDMPLVTPANDFYDVIHSSSGALNRDRLQRLLGRIDTLHGDTARGEATEAMVDRYLDEKVVANAALIGAFARQAIGSDGFTINEVDHDFETWGCFTDRDWLRGQLRSRGVATVHGDLTIENVIIAPDQPHGLYMIDPNPENIFDTPLIDWAKMMQSLHLGYETLNRGVNCSLADSAIRLPTARSQAYAELHATLEGEIVARFGEDSLREVYFHELVNYLRLTPYKIRQSAQRGLAFFACTSLLLRRYRDRFA